MAQSSSSRDQPSSSEPEKANLRKSGHGDSPEEIASPEEFRNVYHAVSDFRLAAVRVAVELLNDPRRARYTYECDVGAAGDSSAADWSFEIPSPAPDLSHVRAWDGSGNLETELLPAETKGTRLRVRFRRAVVKGSSYHFWYEYETTIKSIVCKGNLTQTIVYGDWVIFTMPCDQLKIEVALPNRSSTVETVPASVSSNGDGPCRVSYDLHGRRSLESFNYLVAYRKKKIGYPLYTWVASAIGTGLIGWVITVALSG